jgi:xylan 1,4-beta-xylosidase
VDQALFRCDAAKTVGTLPHSWEHTVGSCHAPLALRADWQAQLRRCYAELGFQYVRFHGLLCDDVGVVTRRNDRLLFSFFNTDQIFDFLLSIGMRPLIELSFMPQTLASGGTTVFHYRGNVTPPKKYEEWSELISKLVAHWIDRYSREEVRRWFFEVWNEPNLKIFWDATREQYFELYRHTVQAIKNLDAQLQIGGPATAKDQWIEEFLDFCDRHRLPVDFVSTHHYPNDVIWYEGQDTETQLANSKRSILRDWAGNTCRRARGLPVYYTEWNCSSNGRFPLQDEPYAAAFVTKTIMEVAELVKCYSFWTFSDIFEEDYFPSVPFHGGFGLLNIHGIPKPAYRAFELLHSLGHERLRVEGRHNTTDAWAIRKGKEITILLTNHALPRQPIEAVQVHIEIAGLPRPLAATIQRIDNDHANAKRAWQEMGRPEYLRPDQVRQLAEASKLTKERLPCYAKDQALCLEVELPPHAVAAITVQT